MYIWWSAPYRKSPDKNLQVDSTKSSLKLYAYEGLYLMEDIISMITTKEINIIFWMSFVWSQIAQVGLWMKHNIMPNHTKHKYIFEDIPTYSFKTNPSYDVIAKYEGKTLHSNIAISYSTRTSQDLVRNDFLPIDQNYYQFVIDTGTTFHICKSKHLFVGDIKRAKNIWIKGVGGKIKVKGYGSIKICVTDDSSHECNLIINNVLYVPESPTNLLSLETDLELEK